MKQNDAVFGAVCSVLGADGFDSAVVLSKDQNNQVVEMVTEGIINGEVDFSDGAREKYNTRPLVRKYVVGMVNNHLRKDKRLNGDTVYVAKNPGSRTGSGDPVLKSLKSLLAICPQENKADIQAEIDLRLESLKPAKPEIDWSLIPESLRVKLGK